METLNIEDQVIDKIDESLKPKELELFKLRI